ncbi:aldo/keto reductase [Anaerovibrio sp.]|uniref:aldo/keto reductase n=1 Tax=Anaerovibrio sp. TaxID=1872532 RepID=UPI0025C6407D|nr:aldo/keto reductase [Anaerovibrio sp.]MBR2143872.1 aldo/keto reductase [Anaerovibrio sp.]
MKNKVVLKNGDSLPPLGIGTWKIGDEPKAEEAEIQAILTGIREGMTLIDTAEMYGDGRSERLVGKVIAQYTKNGARDDLYIVSKVLPWNAGKKKIRHSCENSLKRLGLDYVDLYLYHWIGSVPLPEVVDGLNQLQKDGLIRGWGVSNFDTDDIKELLSINGGEQCLVNQNLYNIGSRGIEYDLIDLMNNNNIALMSYCPLAQGGQQCKELRENSVIVDIANKHNATPTQIILAWNIRNGHTVAIPKSSSPAHTVENAASVNIKLTADDLQKLDKAFPPPLYKQPLDTE